MIINIENNKAIFILRSAAIVINDQKILLARFENGEFWFLPGVSVEALESSEKALKRSFLENLNIEILKQEFVWIVENFYNYNQQDYHEVSFHYRVDLTNDSYIYYTERIKGLDEDKKLEFQWFNIGELNDTLLLPSFLKSKIVNGLNEKEHIIHTSV